MTFTIVLIIILLVSIGVILWLVIKKLPQLRVVNPDTSTESRDRRKKNEILKRRIERKGEKYAGMLSKNAITPMGKALQNAVRTVAGKLTAVERSYQDKKRIAGRSMTDPTLIQEFLEEAEQFLKEEKYHRAEKRLIDIIGLDQKNGPAYELLGRLYLAKQEYTLAEETLRFLVKIEKKDASAHAYLGEALIALNRPEDAFPYFGKAITLSPKNPKYLDFYITTAISLKKKHDATTALDRLKEVNPDNNKIEEFEKQIEALPNYKIQKKKK